MSKKKNDDEQPVSAIEDGMLFGWEEDRQGSDEFLSSLSKPTWSQAAPGLESAGKDVFLGTYLLECYPEWERWSQPIGSCVGWGSSLSLDVLAATDIRLRAEPERFGGRTLEASVYGLSRTAARGITRNLGGDGSTGFHAAKAITKFGSLHYGIEYNGLAFKVLTAEVERAFGRDGLSEPLMKCALEHTAREVTLVETWSDYEKSISNGYPVFICSNRGFGMTMKDGWISPSGVWNHCMMGLAVRVDKPGALIVNSWGDCYRGSVDERLPKQFQRCAAWVEAEVVEAMLSQSDSYAVAGYKGFEPTTMPNWTGGIL